MKKVKCVECPTEGTEFDTEHQIIYFSDGTVKAILCSECRKRYVRPPNINDYL